MMASRIFSACCSARYFWSPVAQQTVRNFQKSVRPLVEGEEALRCESVLHLIRTCLVCIPFPAPLMRWSAAPALNQRSSFSSNSNITSTGAHSWCMCICTNIQVYFIMWRALFFLLCAVYVHEWGRIVFITSPSTASSAVTDNARSNLVEFGRYVQEMMPKYVQLTQITYRYMYMYELYIHMYISFFKDLHIYMIV